MVRLAILEYAGKMSGECGTSIHLYMSLNKFLLFIKHPPLAYLTNRQIRKLLKAKEILQVDNHHSNMVRVHYLDKKGHLNVIKNYKEPWENDAIIDLFLTLVILSIPFFGFALICALIYRAFA